MLLHAARRHPIQAAYLPRLLTHPNFQLFNGKSKHGPLANYTTRKLAHSVWCGPKNCFTIWLYNAQVALSHMSHTASAL